MVARSIVITAPDITDAGYSGMGLRALGVASALSHHHRVSLLVAGVPPDLATTGAEIVASADGRRHAVAKADVVITSNALRMRQLVGLGAAVVSDLYDPSYFEWLVLEQEERRSRQAWTRRQVSALRVAIRTSDVVLCANSRQRDLYLGALLDGAPLRALLDPDGAARVQERVLVVPNAISRTEGLPDRIDARARLGFSEDEVVFLWGGGVWDWLDAATVVEGVLAAHEQDQRVRLVFLGLRRHEEPDPHASRALALLSRYLDADADAPIRANDRWVSPQARLDFLAAADAGILGQFDNLETHFSFRTRLVDCLQAGLPVVTMEGDELSDTAAREGWGLASRIGDAQGIRDHVLALVREPGRLATMRQCARLAADMLTWEHCARPLVDVLDDLERPDGIERLRRATLLTPSILRTGRRQLRRGLGMAAD